VTGAPNFDHLAKPYRWLEYLSFGPFLQRARTQFLPRLASRKSALVLGDGDGRFTARLLRSNPEIQIHAVDLSPGMLRALQKTAGTDAVRVSIEVADLRNWRPATGARFDLITTHFVLDCLTTHEIEELTRRLEPAVEPGAVWVISDFHVPRNHFGHWFAAPLVAGLYLVFRILTGLRLNTLPDHALALKTSGWEIETEQLSLHGLLVSQLWSRRPRKVSG
jgi:ubiquinone/menaquinone biosynthesis C-methylase UbiE